MTSRTTPVGILVIALAGLIAVGCSTSTTAVFQALLDPAATTSSTPEAGLSAQPAVDDVATDTWWPHPDGYAMDLPAGWSGAVVSHDQMADLVEAVALDMPGLATRIGEVIDGGEVRISAIAAELDAVTGTTPVLIVLAEPTDGRRGRELRASVLERITMLPGLTGTPVTHTDRGLNTKAVRFDYSIDDPDLGSLRVRSYLFRFGRQAYLVNFVVSADQAEAADAVFDEIASSLQFGV